MPSTTRPDSYITPQGSFVGPDATKVYQALVLAQACKLLAAGIQPNRAYTRKATLSAASKITGVTYRTLQEAKIGLEAWAAAIRLALPTEPSSDA
jgi:capsular polysaccharide biosynthesis protein